MADDVSAEGKYLLISVPDFAIDQVGQPAKMVHEDPDDESSPLIPKGDRQGQTMSSFLRLGAFHEHPENDPAAKRANELARVALVVSSGQGGPATLPYGAEVRTKYPNLEDNTGVGVLPLRDENGDIIKDEKTGEEKKDDRGVFLDDQRIGDPPWGDDDRENQSRLKEERLAHSAALLTRGGWWDHTDGNRISTTYGDKVEVIRGNYKMVVMSRQDDPGGAGGWDLSGGHLQDLGPASMPGASVRVEFRPGLFGQRGTWHLENTTNNFCQTSDYAGDFYEHWYGNYKHSIVGSENPQEWNADLEKPFGNPEILEKTWASKIESYTGSPNKRVPSITEETYASTTSSTTDVTGDINEYTYCDASIISKTGKIDRPVPAMHEETYAVASNSVSNIVTANDFTTVGAQMETTIAGTLGSLTIAAAQLDTEIIGAKGNISIVGITGEFTLGARVGLTIGWSHEWTIGKHHEEIRIPDKKEIALKELNASLETMHATLNDKSVSLESKLTALQVGIAGVQVQLGL
ncbi:hypothetical protein [Polyangium sp. y55x31]|uniref:hypothetical protein n=1 Tax=Polyangium sp. y55x31 TaxID=3042688 RepID=UPI002482CD77|nr:hypothetical protein [Polyangium sp. y55x31]MDI1480863.1 hypothetical protein [Polyangium sp. y55x31]